MKKEKTEIKAEESKASETRKVSENLVSDKEAEKAPKAKAPEAQEAEQAPEAGNASEERKASENLVSDTETPPAPEAYAEEAPAEAPAELVIEKSEEELVRKPFFRDESGERLAGWKPKTRLGLAIKAGEIKDIDTLLSMNKKILEPEVVDSLVQLKTELISIGQSKGKFGGGKKRVWKQTQRKTAEGNRASFACMCIVGDAAGHIGLGYGKSKETLPAKEKAIINAKINVISVRRGCGSFDCACSEPHSIPFKVEGKVGSSRMVLIPAPRGTGLVIEEECKKILTFAGIKDVYSQTFGQTRTKINLAKACFEALRNTNKFRS